MAYEMAARLPNPLQHPAYSIGLTAGVIKLFSTAQDIAKERGIRLGEVRIGWPYETGHVAEDEHEADLWSPRQSGVKGLFQGLVSPSDRHAIDWKEIGLYVPVPEPTPQAF